MITKNMSHNDIHEVVTTRNDNNYNNYGDYNNTTESLLKVTWTYKHVVKNAIAQHVYWQMQVNNLL